jgi:ABC-type Na+ transport system ATPase subunit NatA
MQITIGLFVCLLLLAFQGIANVVLGKSVLHPPASYVAAPSLCVPGPGTVRPDGAGGLVAGCSTILFAPLSPTIERVMRRMSSNSGLVYNADVAPFPGALVGPPFDSFLVNTSLSNATHCATGTCFLEPSLECLPCDLVRDNATITNYLLANPASTKNVVWFSGAYLSDGADLSHAVLYNFSTTVYPFFADSGSLAVKTAIDRAIVELAAEDASGAPPGSATFDLNVWQRQFPVPVPRMSGYDVFASNGGQWVFVVPMAAFFQLLVDLVYEKEAKLRVGMRQMGLKTSAFWAAWMTYGVALALASTLVMMAAGYAMRFDFFTNTAFGALFLLFFLFSVSMLALAVLLSALISTAKTAQTVGYSIILLGFVIQFILTSAYAGLIDLLYSDSLASWVYTVRRILQLYPPFNFSLFFYDISSLASSTIDFSAGKLVAGPGFFWSDMYESRQRSFAGFDCQLPAPVQSLLLQLMDTAIFIAVALYLDAVLPGPHGSPAHPLFFIGCKYRPHKVAPGPAGRTVAEIAGHGQSRAATAAHAGRAARADENPALAALRAGATDAGVAEETRRAESVPTMSLTSLQRLAGGPGPLHGHEKRPASVSKAAPVSGPVAETDAETAVADLLPILRVSHLRVVYRRGWSAALYALTGIDASAWVKPPAAQGASSYSSFPRCCRRRAPVADYASVPADDGEGAAAAAAAAPAGDNSTRSGDVLAVNDLSFSVRRGEIFALLGHNGCGKSSTISSLTGLFNAAGGEAEILGFDTTAQLDMVQRCMGVCPQHDILWPNLTAEETLRVFAAIKGVPGAAVDAEVERVLLTVRLASVRQRLVGGFSGGMKRRLSVAIAAMGAPSCIFLDEPSTGMVRAVLRSWELFSQGVNATTHCAASSIHATACIRSTSDRVVVCSLADVSDFSPVCCLVCRCSCRTP